ncbi:MAG: lipid A biosynthesis acyltransferase [Burkholderiales bacterium]|nr:lipid A biosynthesis acyltransferase [Burkholderiales bacterium]
MNTPPPQQPAGHLLSRVGIILLQTLSTLPLGVLRPLGRALGSVVWWLARPRRQVTLINLRLCFPQLSERERRRIGREHFQWFMCSILERFIFWSGPPARIEQLVTLVGEEHLQAHLGRPLIFLAPHFVGIDGGGMRLSMRTPMMTIYVRQKNPVLDGVMFAGRSRFPGARPLSRQQGVRATVRLLREGTPLHYSPDMDLGPRESVFVPFFGVPAATITGLSRLARLSGATIIPCVTRMLPGGDGYEVRLYPAWDAFPCGSAPSDVEADTRRMNAFIEERVREMPEQYLWTHKRFKTRPPGEPRWY